MEIIVTLEFAKFAASFVLEKVKGDNEITENLFSNARVGSIQYKTWRFTNWNFRLLLISQVYYRK